MECYAHTKERIAKNQNKSDVCVLIWKMKNYTDSIKNAAASV